MYLIEIGLTSHLFPCLLLRTKGRSYVFFLIMKVSQGFGELCLGRPDRIIFLRISDETRTSVLILL